MKSLDYKLGINPSDIADLHDGRCPKPLRELWLEGKLTSPGAAQQGYWAQREYLERLREATLDDKSGKG